MISRYPARHTAKRAAYARASGDLLVNDPDGFPSDFPPALWWFGYDSGGGATPIGPNGPWPSCGPGLPAVTRATSLITGPIAGAPFRLIDPDDPGRDLPEPRWITDPMLLRPDSRFGSVHPAVNRLSRLNFWVDWVRSAIWWGEGMFLAAEDATGQPIAGTMRLLNPLVLSTERDDSGALVWVIDGNRDGPFGTDAVVRFDREGRVTLGVTPYRLIVLRNPHSPVDSEGRSMGVFAMHPGVFRLGRQINDYGSGVFRSGIPAGYLKVNSPDMSQDKADRLKSAWMKAHGGDRKSIAVLNALTDFVPLNLSPVDTELIGAARLNYAEIAFAFGIDPQTLGVTLANSMTYSNTRDAWINHRDFGLQPWISAVQETLGALTAAGRAVRVDLDGFANPDMQTRYSTYKIGIDAGILTEDEARAMEHMAPIPESERVDRTPPQLLPFTGQQPTNQSDDQQQEQETA